MGHPKDPWPPDPDDPIGHRRRSRANWAGFFGAMPFGPGLVILGLAASGHLDVWWNAAQCAGAGLIVATALVPFAISLARVEPRGWPRVQAASLGGLVAGAVSSILGCCAIPILAIFGLLGLILGLIAIWPCASRGDAAGRALAVLGMTPALLAMLAGLAYETFQDLKLAEVGDPVLWMADGRLPLGLVAVGLAAGLAIHRRSRRRRPAACKPSPRDWEDLDLPGGWE